MASYFLCSIATSLLYSVRSWSPMVASGVKVLCNAKLNVPLDGKLEVNLESSPKTVRFSWNQPRKTVNWLTLETRPLTFTEVMPKSLPSEQHSDEKTVMGEEWTRMYNVCGLHL